MFSRGGVKIRYMVLYRKHDPGESNVTHQDLFYDAARVM